MQQNILITKTAQLLSFKAEYVLEVMKLIDEGATIPFIARYRKERTGNMDEVQVEQTIDSYNTLVKFEKRRKFIISSLNESGNFSEEIKKRIEKSVSMDELEDIYRPYKPGRTTLADKAIKLGLKSLADNIINRGLDEKGALLEAEKYLSKDVESRDFALENALNIIIQEISDSFDVRSGVRDSIKKGSIVSKVKRGHKETGIKYRDYYDITEKIEKIPSHRLMALLRGTAEGVLSLSADPSDDPEILIETITKTCFKKNSQLLKKCSSESLNRHLLKSIGNEAIKEQRERAEKDSVEIFSRNLEKLLLSPPFGENALIAVDPGIRTGCKCILIDNNGDYLKNMTLYLHDKPESAAKLLQWQKELEIGAVVVGDGTYGMETWKLLKSVFQDTGVIVAMVDEDGASVYSASETAREEFPDLDLTLRGAISIGRRFQDPMAELVKIDPSALGIGQYQHDVSPNLLKEKLDRTVEWAVSKVGVNINTAGYHLLGQVSGLDRRKAKAITEYRNINGSFKSIEDVRKVKGIGEKAFQQSSGFLRITDGTNILDSTGVHPESYDDVARIADAYCTNVESLVNDPDMIDRNRIRKELKIIELDSVIEELKLKGLDPRKEYIPVDFDENINSIDDLENGMQLNGVVDNVLAFGAFVDIGIKEKGLVHISEISDEYISDINSVLSTGDRITVKVTGVDLERKRISLSMKL